MSMGGGAHQNPGYCTSSTRPKLARLLHTLSRPTVIPQEAARLRITMRALVEARIGQFLGDAANHVGSRGKTVVHEQRIDRRRGHAVFFSQIGARRPSGFSASCCQREDWVSLSPSGQRDGALTFHLCLFASALFRRLFFAFCVSRRSWPVFISAWIRSRAQRCHAADGNVPRALASVQ